jgi:hypothetical protein
MKIYALARYYLTSDECTYFSFQDQYTAPWSDWFKAIEHDVGQPQGDYFPISSFKKAGLTVKTKVPGADTTNVFARKFTDALILVKTRSHQTGITLADTQSLVTVTLDGDYFPLRADGTLGDRTRVLTLSDFEGSILIPDRRPATEH